jgi:hypothetical protein
MEAFVRILGEICTKKQSAKETLDMLSVIVANYSMDQTHGQTFRQLCETRLDEESRGRVTETYNRCNEEVRVRV